MTLFVESVDVDRAWEVYYQLADRRHKDGLTRDEFGVVVQSVEGLGRVEARCRDHPCEWCGTSTVAVGAGCCIEPVLVIPLKRVEVDQ